MTLKAIAQHELGWMVHAYPWRFAGKLQMPSEQPEGQCPCGSRTTFNLVLQPYGCLPVTIAHCGGCGTFWWMEMIPPPATPVEKAV